MNNSMRETKKLEQKVVLIVDSEEYVVDRIAQCCRAIGLLAIPTTKSSEAMKIIEQRVPDLVILDVDVPTNEDIPLLQLLDIQETKWHVPTIALSKSSDLSSVYRVENLCAYYVHKSPDAWNKIEIFANELVDLSSGPIDQVTDENSLNSDIL